MKGFICTLGFDEKFILRFMVRHKVGENDIFIIIVPEDYKSNEKSFNTYKSVIDFLQTILPSQNIHTITTNIYGDPIEEIRKISTKILDLISATNIVHAALSGGMRVLVIEVLLSLIFLSLNNPLNIFVEVDFENLRGRTVFPLTPLLLRKNRRYILILKRIEELKDSRIKILAQNTGLSPATISRELSSIRNLGLIDHENRLTKLGKAYLSLYSG